MKIYACPKCGSKNIHIGTMDSGVTYGVTSWDYICRDCSYRGMPLIFKTDIEHKKFLIGLKKDIELNQNKEKSSEITDENNIKNEESKLSKTDKEIYEFLQEIINEDDELDEEKTHWHSNRSWWIEIIIAFSISAIINILGFPLVYYSVNNFSLTSIYFIGLFFIEGLFILVIFVIFEYFIYLLSQKMLKK